MKKIIALAVSLVLLISFVGCDTHTGTSSNANSENPFNSPTNQGNIVSLTDPLWYNKIKINNFVSEWTSNVLETDDSFYFVAEDGVYRHNKGNGENHKLLSDKINGISLYGNDLYFCTDNVIKKVDIQTNTVSLVWEKSQLTEQVIFDKIGDFQIYNDYLYIFVNGVDVVRYSISNKTTEVYAEDCAWMIPSENGYYYIDHASRTFSIYYKDDSANQSSLIRGDGITSSNDDIQKQIYLSDLTRVGEKIYYYDRVNKDIYELNTTGQDVLIFDGNEDGSVGIQCTSNSNVLYFYEHTDSYEKIYMYYGSAIFLLAQLDTGANLFEVTDTEIFYKEINGDSTIVNLY